MLRLDESADGREVELPVGDTLELSPPENPTTGLRREMVSRGALSWRALSRPGRRPKA